MRIRDTLRYRLFNWFRNSFFKVSYPEDFTFEMEGLRDLLKAYKEKEKEVYRIMDTWTKNPDMPNFNYANTVTYVIHDLRRCQARYLVVLNKLYLGLADGRDLVNEMSRVNDIANMSLDNIRRAHQDDKSTQDISRDSTESSEGTSTQVRQVPTPGN